MLDDKTGATVTGTSCGQAESELRRANLELSACRIHRQPTRTPLRGPLPATLVYVLHFSAYWRT